MKAHQEEYQIRFANRLDIPALIASDRAASEMFRSTGLIPDMAAIPESIPASVLAQAIGQGMIICAARENVAVGFALCQLQEKSLYLHQLSVDPAHGRKGLGRALVEHVLELGREHKCNVVTLSTFRELAWNGPFYAKLGFREIPRKRLAPWMLEIETDQAATLDTSLRCFMARPVKRSLLNRVV